MSAAQMTRDGIKRLPKWGPARRDGPYTFRMKLPSVQCEHGGCSKRAGYSTPKGNRCFTHALPGESA